MAACGVSMASNGAPAPGLSQAMASKRHLAARQRVVGQLLQYLQGQGTFLRHVPRRGQEHPEGLRPLSWIGVVLMKDAAR